jgi:hypothetical protein
VAACHSVDPAGWRVILDEAVTRVADRFVRAEPRRTAGQLVEGLLSGVERKTCWSLAERAGHDGPQVMHRNPGASRVGQHHLHRDIRRRQGDREILAQLLREHRERLGTRRGRTLWASSSRVSWCCGGSSTGPGWPNSPGTNGVSAPTAYRYLHEGLTVLADHAPDVSTAPKRAAAAGYTHLNLDCSVIRTGRVAAPGPKGTNLWWSGKHKHHGGNVQGNSAPDGWPIWVSPVRPRPRRRGR